MDEGILFPLGHPMVRAPGGVTDNPSYLVPKPSQTNASHFMASEMALFMATRLVV